VAKARNLEFIRQINIQKSLTVLTYLTVFPHRDSKVKRAVVVIIMSTTNVELSKVFTTSSNKVLTWSILGVYKHLKSELNTLTYEVIQLMFVDDELPII
jgi:hypothetical protein